MPSFKPFQALEERPETQLAANGDWQSWDLAPLGQVKRAKRPVAPVVDEHQRQQEELAQQRQLAHQQGYDEGFAEGQAAGYQEGLEQGKQAGYEQGLQEYTQQVQQTLTTLQQLVGHTDAALAGLAEHLSESLTQLALTVGRQLAGEALAANPEHIIDLIRAIITEDPLLSEKPTLLLHPSDAELVEAHLANELTTLGWHWRADASIEAGGCKVTSTSGDIDATIANRWQRIVHHVRGHHG